MTKSPLPTASAGKPAVAGGVHPMGTDNGRRPVIVRHRRETDGNLSAGASASAKQKEDAK
jgi:hypothetical protein